VKDGKNGMRLILIRHGETLWNREKKVQGLSDIELSESGVEQAHRLALALRDEKIDAIYTSPLKRARETARIIGQFHPSPIHVEDGLVEMNQGDFEGLSYHDLMDRHRDFVKQWIADPGLVKMPNGESLAELQERAWRVMESILCTTGDALVVSHNFTIAAILCRIQNISLSKFRSACVATASRTVVDCRNGTFHLEVLNDVEHLRNSESP
jgi:broad specificity phosphatase PhoE